MPGNPEKIQQNCQISTHKFSEVEKKTYFQKDFAFNQWHFLKNKLYGSIFNILLLVYDGTWNVVNTVMTKMDQQNKVETYINIYFIMISELPMVLFP